MRNWNRKTTSRWATTIKEGITVIPYTDQSLAFFDRLRDSMRDMVKKLSFFFDMPSQEAQNLISEETNLLK